MDRTRRRYLRLCAAGSGLLLAGCSGQPPGDDDDDPSTTDPSGSPGGPSTDEKIDDWQYDPDERVETVSKNATGAPGGTATYSVTLDASQELGFAAGGAKNVAAFRRNLEDGYLPLPESLAYEGLFYNYYFDTGESGACDSLFCPSYSTAVTEDPLGEETERYFTVGLNSNLTTESFDRKQLNVVIVLDISGSMSAQFNQYYYDRFGNRHEVEDADESRSKMDVAKDALVALTEQLNPEDRLGIVLFNRDASVAKPLRRVEATDMDAIRTHIREDVLAGGGTNIAAGMEQAAELLGEYSDADQTETETRQIVVTDAMPNTGQTDDQALEERLSGYAADTIHTSFVGVGVDFNPVLVDQITAVRGANYRAVHSAEDFETYLGEEFEYMVTPLVYDLDVELDAEGYDIAKVYGSTAAEEATDDLLTVNTLFPSPESEGETRGGVVLVRIDKVSENGEMTLRASWEDRAGSTGETTKTIAFPEESPEFFANSGIRKAVLLSRYADLLKNWLVYEREPERVATDDGIEIPPGEDVLSEWEQQSQPLTVTEPYDARISQFSEYFESEMQAIGDDELSQELEAMSTILAAAE
ncbi:MAG: VWA domain-containing protein [Halapricum sp.]